MKKSILFMIINMNVGGTEKALLTMLSEIDKEKYDVTLLMLEKYGGFLNDIPEWANVKCLDGFKNIKYIYAKPPFQAAKELFKQGKLIKGLGIGISHLIYKITNDRSVYFSYLLKDIGCIKERYDIAVAYAGPMDLISYYIINKVQANKKIQWIHFDITKIGLDYNFAQKIYGKFDRIFVVSEEAKEKVIENIPTLKNKVDVFYNIVSRRLVKKMAEEEGFTDQFDGTRILTVGRISQEKNQIMTIPILARLKSEGYNVRWYCIGDGSNRKECECLIKKYNLESEYILLGSKTNPYPYMKSCDIYVQPSLHEGYCITLAEAKCFENPIVATNFTGAKEQLIETRCGLVSEIDENDLYIKIKEILDNDKLREQIQSNLRNHISDTSKEISKLYKVIND